jgi:hypothetical protein
MFSTTRQKIDNWMENGKKWLNEAHGQIRNLADRLTPEQFGVVTYISSLNGKWCLYDDQEWIIEY